MGTRRRLVRLRADALHRLPPEIERYARRVFGPPRPWDPWTRLDPPPPEAGQVAGPPDYVGIAAQKAGTSWVHSLLCSHRDVHPLNGGEKELHYFDRFVVDELDATAIETYHRWHSRPEGMRCGEWTPNYLSSVWVPPLLAAAAPEARFLVLLRDPVVRTASGIRHSLSRREWLSERLVGEAVDRSRYGTHLQHWFRYLPKSQFFVGCYEDFVADPKAELTRLLAHLDLPYDESLDARLEQRVHDSAARRHSIEFSVATLSPATRRSMAEAFASELDLLGSLDLDLDVARWRTTVEELA